MGLKSYMLVNPFFDGNLTNVYKAESPIVAAKNAYTSVSKYFSNAVKSFRFTMYRMSKGERPGGINFEKADVNKFLHFKVKEIAGKDGIVDYVLKPIKGTDKSHVAEFQQRLSNTFKKVQDGGSMMDDLDDELDELRTRRKYSSDPFKYWWYYPPLYPYDYTYLPNFSFNLDYVVDYSWPFGTPMLSIRPRERTVTVDHTVKP